MYTRSDPLGTVPLCHLACHSDAIGTVPLCHLACHRGTVPNGSLLILAAVAIPTLVVRTEQLADSLQESAREPFVAVYGGGLS